MITPSYSSSLALLGGWPFSTVAGDGNLGNTAPAEILAREPASASSPAAAALTAAKKNAPAGPAGRLA
jgi:hypothetical protein